MTRKKLLLLVIALIVAGGSAQLVRGLMRQPDGEGIAATKAPAQEAEAAQVRVLVAASDLPAGTLIQERHLRWQAWPESQRIGQTYMLAGERQVQEFVGAVVRRGMSAGEPVTAGLLVKPGERGFLAVVLEPDMRAVSVPVNAVTGIAGFVFPGDRVDLVLTHGIEKSEDPNRKDRRASETVLNNVRVLAIDQTTDDQASTPQLAQIATLEVTPKQAELVILAKELGRLSLSLRSLSREDREPSAARQAKARGFDGLDKRRAALLPSSDRQGRGYTWDSDVSMVLPGPADRNSLTHRVKLLRGSSATVLTFDKRR
jgi:pilus assembly protein CpaB